MYRVKPQEKTLLEVSYLHNIFYSIRGDKGTRSNRRSTQPVREQENHLQWREEQSNLNVDLRNPNTKAHFALLFYYYYYFREKQNNGSCTNKGHDQINMCSGGRSTDLSNKITDAEK